MAALSNIMAFQMSGGLNGGKAKEVKGQYGRSGRGVGGSTRS